MRHDDTAALHEFTCPFVPFPWQPARSVLGLGGVFRGKEAAAGGTGRPTSAPTGGPPARQLPARDRSFAAPTPCAIEETGTLRPPARQFRADAMEHGGAGRRRVSAPFADTPRRRGATGRRPASPPARSWGPPARPRGRVCTEVGHYD